MSKEDIERLTLYVRLLDVLESFSYPQDDQIATSWLRFKIKDYVSELAGKDVRDHQEPE